MKEEQILNSAKELFLNYGYKRVSMTEIANNAKITKRTLYSYFKDKNDLLSRLVTEEIQNMKKLVDKIENQDMDFIDKIHKTLYVLLDYRKKNKLLSMITKEYELEKNHNLNETLKLLDKNIREYIYNKTVFAINNNYIKECNPEILSFVIYKIYVALMFEWDDEKVPLDDKQISDNILNILKNGLLKTKEK